MNDSMKKSLLKIAEILNKAQVQWAVGASLMLDSLGLVPEVHDIDIVVNLKHIERAIQVLEGIGEHIPILKKDEYVTRHFHCFNIDGIDMDVMSGFRIKHSEGIYEFPMDSESIVKFELLDDVKIPYTSVEDWYVAYMLMKERDWKVDLIRNYLYEHGVKYPQLFDRVLKQSLPKEVEEQIRVLL